MPANTSEHTIEPTVYFINVHYSLMLSDIDASSHSCFIQGFINTNTTEQQNCPTYVLGFEVSGLRHIQVSGLDVVGSDCSSSVDHERSKEDCSQRDDTEGEHVLR